MISKPTRGLKLGMQNPGNILRPGNLILGLTSRTKPGCGKALSAFIIQLSQSHKSLVKLVFNFTYKLFNLILKYVTFW